MSLRLDMTSKTRNQVFNTGLVVVVCASLVVQYYPAASIYAEVVTLLCLIAAAVATTSKLIERHRGENLSTGQLSEVPTAGESTLRSHENHTITESSIYNITVDINVAELRRQYLFSHPASTEAILNFHKLVTQEARNSEIVAKTKKIRLEASKSKVFSDRSGLPITVSWDEFIQAANTETEPAKASNQNISPDAPSLLAIPNHPTMH